MSLTPTRVHHLTCATLCPSLRRVPGLMPDELVAHVLLLETAEGLVLVDTGFGTDDVAQGGRRLGRAFVAGVGPRLDLAQTALHQVRALGHDPADVRHVVLTHLDLDHAGGLADFPDAQVHLHRAELAAALTPRLRERQRYVAAQWAHGPRWQPHDAGGEDWCGFTAVRAVGDDVLLVPLPGHTRGHSGVAVRRPSGGWFLHAGDAYFFHGDKERPRSCPPGLRSFQVMVQADRTARLANLERLQELHATRDDVTVFCAHDRAEYLALEGVTD